MYIDTEFKKIIRKSKLKNIISKSLFPGQVIFLKKSRSTFDDVRKNCADDPKQKKSFVGKKKFHF